MSTIPVQTLADWIRCELSGVHPRLEAPFASERRGSPEATEEIGFGLASLELTPDDLSGNPYFRDVDAFGDPELFPLELPPRPTGRLIFASEATKVEEETCQNLTPFPEEAYSWTGFQPIIRGFPYRKNTRNAPFARPGEFRVENVPLEQAGFPAGDCTLFRCLEISKLLTEPDDGADFSLTQGQGFAVPAERNLPRGVKVAYFLGYGATPSERYANARELRVTTAGRREVVFTNYRDTGRRLPQKNETDVDPPREPRRRRDFRFAHKNGGDVGQAEVRVFWTYVTLRGLGETRASRPSERFDAEPGKNTALWVDPPPRERGADGWKLYIVVGNVSYVFTRLGNPARAAGFLPFGTGRVPVHIDPAALSGNTLGNAPSGGGGKARIPRWGLTQMDPPGRATDTEAIAGLEPLEGALTAPRTFRVADATFAQNKWYTFRIADAAEDASGELLQGLPSRSVRHFLPAGFAPRVVFPDPLNGFENAEGGETRADGKPVAWGFQETNGTYKAENGVHEIRTAGSGAASPSFWQAKDVDQSRDVAFAGRFAAAMGNGSAEAVLQEFDVPAASVSYDAQGTATPQPKRTTVLASGAAVEADFSRVFGPTGDLAWHVETVSRRFVVRMAGATRNGRASVASPVAGPDGVVGRRVEKGGPHEAANFAPTVEARLPRGPLAALGPAPRTGGEVSVEEPFETLRFTGAAATEPGTSPGGAPWTKEVIRATAQMATNPDGSRVLRTQDANMGLAAHARYWRNVSEWVSPSGASSGGLRVVEDLGFLARQINGLIERGRIADAAGNIMASCEFVLPSGEVRLRIRDRAGKERTASSGVRVRDGERPDWEIVPSGGDTEDGRAILLVGTNGEDRRQVASLGGIDWTGKVPARAYFGAVRETNPQSRSTFDVREVQLSRNGAPIGEVPSGAAQVPSPPDRPTGVDPFGNPAQGGAPSGASEATGAFVEVDPDGAEINQWALWVPPNTTPFDTPVFFRMAVLPGQTYSLGLRGRHARYLDEYGGALLWWVAIVAEDGREMVVGSLYGAGGASFANGRSGWANLELSGALALTVPEDFGAALLTIRHRNVVGGFYLFQDFCPSVGTAVRRGFGRSAEGRFAAFLDSRPAFGVDPDGAVSREPAHSVDLREGWVGPRAAADVPAGCFFGPFFNSSDSEAPVYDLPDVGNPALVRAATFARIGGVLTGDGREGAEVPAGAVALETRPFDSALLRGDGTEPDAGTLLFGVEEPADPPDYETVMVDKSPENEPTTSRVPWLGEFTLQVFSAATKAELESFWLDREWRIMAVDHGDGGVVYQVKFSAPLKLERAGAPYTEGNPARRYGLWTARVAGARVLESWPVEVPTGTA